MHFSFSHLLIWKPTAPSTILSSSFDDDVAGRGTNDGAVAGGSKDGASPEEADDDAATEADADAATSKLSLRKRLRVEHPACSESIFFQVLPFSTNPKKLEISELAILQLFPFL